MDNDLFERHSWYFRNALVRASYRNLQKGINYEPLFLVRFFRNLLLGENNTLKNRYMMIDGSEEWKMPESEQAPELVPEQVPEQVYDKLHTDNSLIIELVKVIGDGEFSVSQLMEKTGLKHRPNFIEYHLNPALSEGYIRQLYPDKPRHPRQKYLLTVKGLALYNDLNHASTYSKYK